MPGPYDRQSLMQRGSFGQQNQLQMQGGGMPQMQGGTGYAQMQQGLPPTGLQQQMASLNQFYEQIQGASVKVAGAMQGMGPTEKSIGFDPRAHQFGQGQQELGGVENVGGTSLDALARSLADSYGLAIGRGRLVDERGNFLMTPEQIVQSSGGAETLGTAAAKLNFIAQAVSNEQNRQQQQKGITAIQAGMSQVQSRGRGSLAAMQSGMYQDLADLYSNQEYEAADFSYWIQKEQLDIAQELQRRYERMVEKRAQGQFIGGIAMAALGGATGNWGVAAQGVGMAAGSYGETGWF